MTPTMRPQPRFNNMGSGGSAMMQAIRQRRQQAMAQQSQAPQQQAPMAPMGQAPPVAPPTGGGPPPIAPGAPQQSMAQAAPVAPPNGGGPQAIPGGPTQQAAPQQSQAIQSTNPMGSNPYAAAAAKVAGGQNGASNPAGAPLRGQPGGPPAYSATNLGPGQTAAMYAPGGIFDPAMTANMPPGQGTAIRSNQPVDPALAARYGGAAAQNASPPRVGGGGMGMPQATGGPAAPVARQPNLGTPGMGGGQQMAAAPPPTAPAPNYAAMNQQPINPATLGTHAPAAVASNQAPGTPGTVGPRPTTPPTQPAPTNRTPAITGGGMGMPQRGPQVMARGGMVPHVRHAHPMRPHMSIPRRGLPMEQPSEDMLPREPTDGGAEGPPAPPGIHTPQYAHGGFPVAPTARIQPMRSESPLANPMPMARQMARYRSQGGPAANIEKPMTSPKYQVNSGKNSQRRFPMPKSEMGSITSSAYQ